MGLFDYVDAPSAQCQCCGNEIDAWQTKDTPSPYMQHIGRDEVDEHGKYLVNEYYSFCEKCYMRECDNPEHKNSDRHPFMEITFKRVQLDWKQIPEKSDG